MKRVILALALLLPGGAILSTASTVNALPSTAALGDVSQTGPAVEPARARKRVTRSRRIRKRVRGAVRSRRTIRRPASPRIRRSRRIQQVQPGQRRSPRAATRRSRTVARRPSQRPAINRTRKARTLAGSRRRRITPSRTRSERRVNKQTGRVRTHIRSVRDRARTRTARDGDSRRNRPTRRQLKQLLGTARKLAKQQQDATRRQRKQLLGAAKQFAKQRQQNAARKKAAAAQTNARRQGAAGNIARSANVIRQTQQALKQITARKLAKAAQKGAGKRREIGGSLRITPTEPLPVPRKRTNSQAATRIVAIPASAATAGKSTNRVKRGNNKRASAKANKTKPAKVISRTSQRLGELLGAAQK